jgi:hypothetical protein
VSKEFCMKKSVIAIALAIFAAAGTFAAGNRDSVITVEGTIAVTKGVPSVVSGSKTYDLPAAHFYQIAWENGIKVGDKVKLEGYERTVRGDTTGQNPMFMPTKVWLNGKELDLSNVRTPMMNGAGPQNGMGPGNGKGAQDTDDRGPSNDDARGRRGNQ